MDDSTIIQLCFGYGLIEVQPTGPYFGIIVDVLDVYAQISFPVQPGDRIMLLPSEKFTCWGDLIYHLNKYPWEAKQEEFWEVCA